MSTWSARVRVTSLVSKWAVIERDQSNHGMNSEAGYSSQTLPRYTSSFADPQPIERFRMRLVDLTVQIPYTDTKIPLDEARSPPRWKTLEFRFYLLVACVVVPIMAWIPMSLSLRGC